LAERRSWKLAFWWSLAAGPGGSLPLVAKAIDLKWYDG
jgi:hypothetical protein